MVCVFPAGGAEFLQLHSVRVLAFVARGRVITIFALFASQDDNISHRLLPIVLVDYTGDHAATDGVSTFTDSKTKPLLHGNRGNQLG